MYEKDKGFNERRGLNTEQKCNVSLLSSLLFYKFCDINLQINCVHPPILYSFIHSANVQFFAKCIMEKQVDVWLAQCRKHSEKTYAQILRNEKTCAQILRNEKTYAQILRNEKTEKYFCNVIDDLDPLLNPIPFRRIFCNDRICSSICNDKSLCPVFPSELKIKLSYSRWPC